MDKKRLEDMIKPSVMESFDKIHTSIDPLYKVRNSLSILEVAKQYEHMNSISSVGEIARKAFQHSGLDIASLENQSIAARFSQLQAEKGVDFQYLGLEATEGMNTFDDIISTTARPLGLADSVYLTAQPNSIASQAIFSIYGRGNIEKVMSDINLTTHFPDSMYEQLDIANRYKDLFSLSMANSFAVKQAVAFKQFDQFSVLESFKALSRLENFPFNSIMTTESDSIPDLEESASVTVLQLDSEISNELSTVNDFNQLSEERRTILINLYRDYYYPIILTYLVIGVWWNIFFNNNLDLSNRVFVYFESTKGVFSYLSTNVYRPVSGVIDGLVASFIYMNFPEFKRNSNDVGVKKAIKMLFYSSDSFINRSMLKGYRVITEDNTYLRESYHVDAIEIEILSKGTIVRVVEKEGKSWLLVEPLLNTEIGKGWILRSSTTTFK